MRSENFFRFRHAGRPWHRCGVCPPSGPRKKRASYGNPRRAPVIRFPYCLTDSLPTMRRPAAQPIHQPTEAEIQHAAYLLWLEAGRPHGCDLDHWFAAKAMLRARHGRDARTGPKAVEIAPPAL